MPTLDELSYGSEIRGVVCAVCGGTLVHRSAQIYCDWCDAFVDSDDECYVEFPDGYEGFDPDFLDYPSDYWEYRWWNT